MKIVIVCEDKLPVGIMANTVAALSMSCSLKIPWLVGRDVFDADKGIHPGILMKPVAVLFSGNRNFGDMRLYAAAMGLEVICFTGVAVKPITYEEYTELVSGSIAENLNFPGICIFGDKGKATSITGSLPLVKYKENIHISKSRSSLKKFKKNIKKNGFLLMILLIYLRRSCNGFFS